MASRSLLFAVFLDSLAGAAATMVVRRRSAKFRSWVIQSKLESCNVWRTWLGDSVYSTFVHFLSSPSTWDSFMRSVPSKSRAQIHLQLRARALHFDKASASLFLRPDSASNSSSSLAVSDLNPNYLQLHADDVYFTLENEAGQAQQRDVSKVNSKL